MVSDNPDRSTDARVRDAVANIDIAAPPGEVARIVRLARGLSLKQVAEKIGAETHYTTIGKLETGKRRFTADWGYLLAEALAVPSSIFYDASGSFREANRFPVYTSLAQALSHPDTAATSFEYFAGSRSDVYGFFFTGHPDLADEISGQTALVDPHSTDLKEGRVYLFHKSDDDIAVIGIYRSDHSTPRVIRWPALTTELGLYGPEYRALGQVFEIRRYLASPHI